MSKMNSLDRTLKELALEGIGVSDDLHNDMKLLEQGKISQKEFLERAKQRATHDERSLSIPRNTNVN
jgi:hypothetical protein